MHIWQKISYFIYPPRCYSCKTEIQSYGLCSKCYLKLSFSYNKCFYCNSDIGYNKNLCEACMNKVRLFENIYFACLYQDVIKKLIYDYKFNDQTDLSSFFANLIYYYTNLKKKIQKHTIIIPVPLHRYRMFKRGYNQTVLLGNALIKLLNCEMNTNILFKTHNTKQQIGLNKSKRIKNLDNSFELRNSHLIKNKHIILLDDVITTGATIHECAKTINLAKVSSIDVIAIAKVEGILKI